MKTILVLHTGGTISMSETEQGHVAQTSSNPLLSIETSLPVEAKLIQEDFLQLPSPHITPIEMMALKERIDKAFLEEEIDGVVITHGTDTLEETAYFLDLTIHSLKPVVVTGAMRSSNELGSDGLINLKGALLVALSPESYGKGTLVVMNDEIHTAKYVTKTHTTNLATFQTPTFGPIGLLSKNNVLYFQALTQQEVYHIHTLEKKNIYIVKAYAGMDSFLLNALNQSQTDGVVIEALGAGNLPPDALEGIQALLANHIPIVLVSRAFNGVTQDVYDYEGGGKRLKEAGVIFTTGLSGQKARLKLLILLNTPLTKPLKEYF